MRISWSRWSAEFEEPRSLAKRISLQFVAIILPFASAYLEAVSSPDARACGTQGMAFAPMEALAAAGLPGSAIHAEVADRLTPVIEDLL